MPQNNQIFVKYSLYEALRVPTISKQARPALPPGEMFRHQVFWRNRRPGYSAGTDWD
jgi:hypothetical protein